jgi:RNA polymerase sigma factor (sigma-70 family)
MIRQIGESYQRTVAVPIPDRRPVAGLTQDEIAVAVALDMSGKKCLSPIDRLQYNTALYESIRNLLLLRANKYLPTCPLDTVDDLAQECMYKILKKLHGFKPEKGKFSTWAWYVCSSTLNRRYRTGQRTGRHIILGQDDGDHRPQAAASRSSTECPGIMAAEIMDAVRELAGKYPQHRPLIFEMFGNPDSDDFVMRSHISVSESAKAVGMDYSRARTLYSRVIRPFLKKQLAGC